MHFYPHNIADFNNATRHLTRVQRSVYRDAIERYYDKEEPLDGGDFSRLCRVLLCISDDEVGALRIVLDEFFVLIDGLYRHDRCDLEIAKYRANSTAKARAGKASAEARKNKRSTHVEQQLNSVQQTNNQQPITNNQQPITKEDNKKPLSQATQKKNDYPNWFDDLWKLYPTRAGSNDKRKAYQAASARLKDGRTHQELFTAVERYKYFVVATGKVSTEYVKQGATFFGPNDNLDNPWTVPLNNQRGNATNGQQPKSPIERFMQSNYPAGTGGQDGNGHVGSDDGAIRGEVDESIRGIS